MKEKLLTVDTPVDEHDRWRLYQHNGPTGDGPAVSLQSWTDFPGSPTQEEESVYKCGKD